jgi:hypothetical protein
MKFSPLRTVARLGALIVSVALSAAGLVPGIGILSASATTAYTVTIVSSGGAAVGSGWSYSSGVITPTASVSIAASTLVSYLGSGALTVNADTLDVNASIVETSSASDLTLKSTGNIVVGAGVTINTHGGALLFDSDSDGSGQGDIRIGLPTDSSPSSLITGGGNLTLSGGTNPTTGYGMATTADVPSGGWASGTACYGCTLNAGGGNIIVRGGSSNLGNISTRALTISNISTGSGIPATVETSGAGTISLVGNGTQIAHNNAWGVLVQTSTISTENGSITVTGTGHTGGSPTNPRGVVISGTTNWTSTGGGAISLIDNSNGTVSPYSGWYNGGTATFTTTGHVTLQGDKIVNSGTLVFATPQASIVPYSGASFTGAYSTGTINATNCNDLILGDVGNTQSMTIGTTALTVGGPLTVYGGAVAFSVATAATNSTINIVASGAVTQTAALTASNLVLSGTGSFTLQGSNAIGTIASSTIGSLAFNDTSALTIGSVATANGAVSNVSGVAATGAVSISTVSGSIALTEPVSSNLSSGVGIELVAGTPLSAGTAGTSDITVSGSGAITPASGARALLFSGQVTDSTGLAVLSSNAKTRAPFDWTELNTISPSVTAPGVYVIYRVLEAQTITSPTVESFYGLGESVAMGSTSSSGLTVTYAVTNGTATGCAVDSSGNVTATGTGTCELTISQAGNNSYAAATSVSAEINFSGAPQTISAPATPSDTTWQATQSVYTTSSSGLTVTYAITGGTADGCSVTSNGVVSASDAGTCVVTISQSGNNTYAAASDVVFTVTFLKIGQAITAPSALSSSMWNTAQTVGTVASSTLAVTYAVTGGTASGCAVDASGSISATSAGTCVVTLTQDGDAQYNAATPVVMTATFTGLVNLPASQGLPSELTPGDANNIIGGVTSTCGTAPNAQRNGIVTTTCALDLALSAVTSSGAKAPLNAQNQLVAVPGRNALTGGGGFAPFSMVTLFIYSNAQAIGHGLTNGSGVFSILAAIPRGLALGVHTIQVVGYAPNGQLETANIGVLVVAGATVYTVHFAMDSWTLTAQDQLVLSAILKTVGHHGAGSDITITGYAQPTFVNEHYRRLSALRAASVGAYLRSIGDTGRVHLVAGGNRDPNQAASRCATVSVS